MLDRTRAYLLTWSAVCLALLAVLAVAVAQGWGWVADFDDRGDAVRDWAVDDTTLRQVLRVVELAFSTIAMAAYTAALAIVMFVKSHRRAAYYAVAVMAATSAATTLIKLAIGRDRPEWQETEWLLSNHAFPSGHASSVAAFGGVVVVLATMLLRRPNMRRLISLLVAVVVVAVCLDRVLLGRHFPTDVIGGTLLGAAFVLLGLVVLSPLPRSHAEKIAPLPDVLPPRRKLAVILNPIKVEDVGQFQSIVDAMAVEAGWSTPTWHLTTVEDSGTGQAERASMEGPGLVIVCGGDGTVREVCAELAGTGIPVGIVPAGTGNLLARNLDIPLYIRAAIDIALTGQDRAIDMVKVTGDHLEDSHFMVMAGMGFDAAIMEGVNEDLKKRVGWVAYVVSGLKSLMFPAIRVDISVDGGEPTTHRARTIVVGNVGFLQAGMPLLPDAAIDDGVLDVVILHPRNFFSWIPLAVRVMSRGARTDDTINRMTGQRVSITASIDAPRQLDGDSVGPGRELHMECIHGRLLVRVPR
ncbi:YegS/Rv2252/BmrU family lipid kinase [Nocardioides sp. cx-169]|uniref:YegS/Rv2252/BmrU family lipid kinase n=1 Tax=Nocardioides sp. cx-169 TaxID=2899080 RepID=UPI001E448666|nr:YegS/Rv2252/BmrU family lipid kinase [Nocardioides sp. cx-169]MCD4532923.1 YegS/Rv2252/BmrU family lipid kinase [Nocardioides sp. cx-169]